MKPTLLVTMLMMLCYRSIAQTAPSFYATIFGRYDVHANYRPETNFNTPIGPPTKLSGKTIGINFGYQKHISNRLYLNADLGFNRMYVDKIKIDQPEPYNIPPWSNSRYLLVPGGGTLGAQGYKYWYNNLQLQTGLGYLFPVSDYDFISTSIAYCTNFTISQRYFYRGENPPKFVHKKLRHLGSGLNFKLGYVKNMDYFYLQPEVIISIYQRLSGDPIFEEVKTMRTTQWFGGGGISIKAGIYLHNNR